MAPLAAARKSLLPGRSSGRRPKRGMLTYGATVHFIVPELDAGDQIIHQETFTVDPGNSGHFLNSKDRTDPKGPAAASGGRGNRS